MNCIRRQTSVLATLTLLMLPGVGGAQECFSPSPSASKGEPLTEEIAIRDLTKTEHGQLKALFENLKGRWSGSGQELECEGTPENLRKKLTPFDAEAELELDAQGELRMDLTRESREEGTSRQSQMSLHLSDERLRVRDDDPSGDVQILAVSAGRVAFLKKRAHRTQRGGVATQESVTNLQLSGRKLQVELTTYSNGVLSAVNTFDLNRK